MVHSLRIAMLGLLASASVLAAAPASAGAQTKTSRIEVAFVLDTTGSMAGLIDGAKRKIWSIANSIVDVNPDADIRMAVIGYRDRGDDYVVKTHDMTGDIQSLYGNLIRFEADGGGDTPESVNEALHAGVNDLGWTRRQDVRRILFLVGDAPPHMDYRKGPKYADVIANARDANIIVNTIQAGADPETTEYWTEMARLGGGQYFAIPQDGGQVSAISSPFDQDIIRLQGRIDGTIILYGTKARQEETRSKVETRAAAPSSVQVDNSRYYAKKMASREVVTGGGDLLDDVRNKVRSVDEIAADELPAEMKGKSAGEIKAIVAARTAEREKLEADMAELVRQRDDYVAKEAAKAPAGEGDSFDSKVKEALSAQF